MSGIPAVPAVDVTTSLGSVTALGGISMTIGLGETYGVLGPDGAGKATLLRMLFGLIRPDGGELEVMGRTWPVGLHTFDGAAGFIESPPAVPPRPPFSRQE